MWREENGEGEKEVGEISLEYMDFEVPQGGHSSSGVQWKVGNQGLRLRGGNSLEIQIWESPVLEGNEQRSPREGEHVD